MLNTQCDLTVVLNIRRDFVSVADTKDQVLFQKQGVSVKKTTAAEMFRSVQAVETTEFWEFTVSLFYMLVCCAQFTSVQGG